MKPSRLMMFALLAAVFAGPPCRGQIQNRSISKHSPGLPVWTPGPKLAVQLDRETAIEGWILRPPKQYVTVPAVVPDAVVHIWQGGRRPNGTAPNLLLQFGDAPSGLSAGHQAEEMLDNYLTALRQSYQDWAETSRSVGTINGRRFVRIHWTAIDPRTAEAGLTGAQRTQGITFVTVVNSRYLAASAYDLLMYKGSIVLMEASIETVRKR